MWSMAVYMAFALAACVALDGCFVTLSGVGVLRDLPDEVPENNCRRR